MQVHVTQETVKGCNTIVRSKTWGEAVPVIMRAVHKGGIIKVFEDDSLALIVNGERFKNTVKIQLYSNLKKAVKAYEMNVEAGVFCPTVEVC